MKKVKKTEETAIDDKCNVSNTSFETFRNMSENYWKNSLKQDKPSSVNSLSYRKYKVSIELIEETSEVLIERLLDLLSKTTNHYHASPIKSELRRLGYEI